MKTTILTSAPCPESAIAALLKNLQTFSHTEVEILYLGSPGLRPPNLPDPVQFFSAQEQVALLSVYSPELARSFGYNAPVRTLPGLFKAWIDGASHILLWDGGLPDATQDFLGAHHDALALGETPQLSTGLQWCNIYATLNVVGDTSVFPRGFPHDLRKDNGALAIAESAPRPTRVVANSGLRLGPLDMDSISRLERTSHSLGWRRTDDSVTLAPGVWCPFPAANLMLRREAIPAYFLCGYLENYGAVWASFLLQRVAAHLGEAISFGAPFLASSAEVQADPWLELDRERPGLRRTGELAKAIRHLPLHGGTYGECIQQIAADLPLAWPQGLLRGPHAWSGYSVEWRKRFLDGLRLWVEACESAAARSKANLYNALEPAAQDTATSVMA